MKNLNICYSITENDFYCIKTRKYYLKNKHNSSFQCKSGVLMSTKVSTFLGKKVLYRVSNVKV